MPETFKTGIITIMYKNKGNTEDLKNWRPISLLNVDYKIFTKIFKNRLKQNANLLINNLQSCAPGERSILDNALNLNAIQEYAKSENIKTLFIAIDQEKAFDRLEHNYIISVFKKYKFPNLFIKFLQLINLNTYSYIQVNGMLSNKINIKRSVRQGCPISMYLYAFALEPLVQKIENNKHIIGINIPNYEKQIKTIQHADDTTVILRTESSFVYLKNELNHFENSSGSKANEEKFEILKLGNWNLTNYDIPKQSVKENIKIVGIYFGNNVQEKNYRLKIDKIKNRIKDWSVPYNLYNKAIIIKTYLLSIIMYTMTVIPISSENAQEITSIIYKFIWNGQDKLKRKT